MVPAGWCNPASPALVGMRGRLVVTHVQALSVHQKLLRGEGGSFPCRRQCLATISYASVAPCTGEKVNWQPLSTASGSRCQGSGFFLMSTVLEFEEDPNVLFSGVENPL